MAPLAAAEDPLGGTIGGGDEEQDADADEQVDAVCKSTVTEVAIVLVGVGGAVVFESFRRNNLAEARLKSARLTRPL